MIRIDLIAWLFAAAIAAPPAHAGWLRDTCTRLLAELVSEDPEPYHDHPADELLDLFAVTYDKQIGAELAYRQRQLMLTYEQGREYFYLLNRKDGLL